MSRRMAALGSGLWGSRILFSGAVVSGLWEFGDLAFSAVVSGLWEFGDLAFSHRCARVALV